MSAMAKSLELHAKRMTLSSSVKKRKKAEPLYRDMEYLKADEKARALKCQEHDAVIRFYAMLNQMVTFKGRPAFDIENSVVEIRIKQPLETAFYKVFQAMLNYPSNRPLEKLVQFTCHEVLFVEIEKLKESLGLKKETLFAGARSGRGSSRKLTAYQRKARECRMKIYEDTMTRFFQMVELYTPYEMRPRLWDEQVLPEEHWNSKVKQPLKEAFETFIVVMRDYPTKLKKQKLLVMHTLNTILPNCETGMSERGIRYELTYHGKEEHRNECGVYTARSVWEHDEDDMKIALRYKNEALRMPSMSAQSRIAHDKYAEMTRNASQTYTDRLTQSNSQLSTTKSSQLQKLSVSENDKPSKDFSWIKLDGSRVIKKNLKPDNSKISAATTKYTKRTVGIKTAAEVWYAAPSSSTTIISEYKNYNYTPTEAISYRPILSASQRQKALSMADDFKTEEAEQLYGYLSRRNTGFPEVHAKRRREVKSAPVYEKSLHKQSLVSNTESNRKSCKISLTPAMLDRTNSNLESLGILPYPK